ncbi:MAG: 5-dehydro-4-deoxyglucarate dehydratase [Terriglobia bacterium]
MARSPEELRAQLAGLFAFPVTPFTHENQVDFPRYRENLQFLIDAQPAALFVCCGTGEFFSLDLAEYQALVKAGVEEAFGKLPVLAGVGYGARLAIEFAKAAEKAGADGLLVMPPYLIRAAQEGLYQHYRSIAASINIGVIVYQRDNAIFAPATVRRLAEIPNVVGFKDGHGDMERLLRIGLAVGERLAFMNGMPTAELSARAFRGVGVSSYSSAVFNFVPEIARAFYCSLTEQDEVRLNRLMEGFYEPLAELRDRVPGYAISLIKAGLKIMGRPSGGTRPPLIDPPAEHEQELKWIIRRGLSLVRSFAGQDHPSN